MSAFAAKTARPPNAAIAWVATDGLYVEYPVKGGGPNYIVRYRKTVEDLANALGILVENSVPAPTLTMIHPGVRRVGSSSQEQRDLAAKIVREKLMGLKPT